jgi:hypothetical protein
MEVRVLSSALFFTSVLVLMNCNSFLAASLLALCLVGSGPVNGMSLIDFGHLNNDDEATYVALLLEGAAKILKARGQPDQADKAIALFHDPGTNGGMSQFALNLRAINTLNSRNSTNPNNRAPVYGIEDAMAQTLGGAGINVPVSDLKAIGQDFKPAGPPRHTVLLPSNDL